MSESRLAASAISASVPIVTSRERAATAMLLTRFELIAVPESSRPAPGIDSAARTNVIALAATDSAIVRKKHVTCLSVADDGHGFDPAAVQPALGHGWGLMNMRERAAAT